MSNLRHPSSNDRPSATPRPGTAERVVRLFVSSPGDVAEERLYVERVVERLNAEFARRVRIETIRWEAGYYSAHDSFQGQIPEAATCDIVVAIFKARLGTALPSSFPKSLQGDPYPSGTAYEILSAIESRRAGKPLPDIYVFRYPRAPLVALDAPDRGEVEAQWQKLKRFFETWFQSEAGEFLAAFQDYDSTDTFARRLEECLRQWLGRNGHVAGPGLWDRLRLGSPFPGLEPFGRERALVFCGREATLERALRHVRDSAASGLPVLLVAGASGAGKTSLIQAGLLPRITQPGFLPEVDEWRVAVVRPGADPITALAEALTDPQALAPALAKGPFETGALLARQLRSDPDSAARLLLAALSQLGARPQGGAGTVRLLLAVDQLERLFEEALGQVEHFARILVALAESGGVVLVLGLRSDAYSLFQAVPDLVRLREGGSMFDLLPPSRSELEDMVTLPAARCEPPLVFEERERQTLAHILVEDARGGDALPLLQMSLARLHAAQERRGDGVLRFADYDGLGEAVARTANEALEGLPEEAKAELPALVAGLVRDVVTDPATGAQVPMPAPLDRTTFEAANPARKLLLDRFVAARLLSSQDEGGRVRVRAVHEALLRIWPQGRTMVAQLADAIRVRHALDPLSRAWDEAPADRKPAHLAIAPALLEGGRDLALRFGADLPESMKAFIDSALAADAARRQAEQDERDRRVRDARALAAAERRTRQLAVAALAVTVLFAGAAAWQWQVARLQRDRAERSLALATRTASALVDDLAVRFRNVVGIPAATVKAILERARALQDDLIGSGESTRDLRRSRAAAQIQVARTLLDLGDSVSARASVAAAHDTLGDLAGGPGQDIAAGRLLAAASMLLGEIDVAQGQLPAATQAFGEALALRRALASRAEGTAEGPAVAEALDRLSEVYLARGEPQQALEAAQQGLALREEAAKAAGATATAPDIALSQERVGNAQLALGHLPEALDRYASALDVWRSLSAREPDNAALLERTAILAVKMADILARQGRADEALRSYRESLAIRQQLVAADPGRAPWQMALSVVEERVGTVAAKMGRSDEALEAQQNALSIRRRLVAADPANAVIRRDLSVALNLTADALKAVGRGDEALALLQESNAIVLALVSADPTHVGWLSDQVWVELKIGATLQALGRPQEALAAYRSARTVAVAALARSPDSPDRVRELALVLRSLGDLEVREGAADQARTAYEESLALFVKLVDLDPSNADWRAERTDALGGMAYNLVFLRDFQKALEAAELAIGQRPQLEWLYLNRAHALMFLGRAEDAMAVHREHRGRPTFGSRTWEAAVLQNFGQLRAAGLDHPQMSEIGAMFRDPP